MQINPGGTRKGSGSCRAAALPGSAPGRALGGGRQQPKPGGGSGGASQPRHPAGREPPAGHRPFKRWSRCLPPPPPRLLEGLRQPLSPPSVCPPVRPSLLLLPARLPAAAALRAAGGGAGSRRAAVGLSPSLRPRVPVSLSVRLSLSLCPCPCPGAALRDHGMLHRALHPDFPLRSAAGKCRSSGGCPSRAPTSCRDPTWGMPEGCPGRGGGSRAGTKPPGTRGRQGKGRRGQPGARCGAWWCLNLGETRGCSVSCWLLWVWLF